jgi:hypothetical protein
MSDSEGGLPSEATISQKLRDVVIAIHKTGKDEDLTVKRIRARAEKELSLPEGFLKKDAVWKQKSQTAINAAVVSTTAIMASTRSNDAAGKVLHGSHTRAHSKEGRGAATHTQACEEGKSEA